MIQFGLRQFDNFDWIFVEKEINSGHIFPPIIIDLKDMEIHNVESNMWYYIRRNCTISATNHENDEPFGLRGGSMNTSIMRGIY